jgi:molybdopterin-containing oxidoreductase family iron-sulfur binding subunit
MDACRIENNLPEPKDPRLDVHYIRKVRITRKHSTGELETPLPLMCNHCDNPPCVQVCPVKASFKRDDGIVMCDAHRCIGCRYCLIACPYNARYFSYQEALEEPTNPDFPQRAHGVSQACTFCSHLVDQGKLPACVQACERIGAGALVFGDLNDPDSEISRIIAENRVQGLREDLGTEPKVYYLGL